MRRRRIVAALAAAALAALALAGCGARPGPAGPRFEVSSNPSPVWEPVGIRLLALPPGQQVTTRASANFPVLFMSVLWKDCTTRGAVVGGFLGLISSVVLTVLCSVDMYPPV